MKPNANILPSGDYQNIAGQINDSRGNTDHCIKTVQQILKFGEVNQVLQGVVLEHRIFSACSDKKAKRIRSPFSPIHPILFPALTKTFFSRRSRLNSTI
ncbi:MAG: hypothetical protein ACOY4H_12565 [Thermodesulfobacteriota bacterium]